MNKQQSGGLTVILIAVVLLGLAIPCLIGAGLLAFLFVSQDAPSMQPIPPVAQAEISNDTLSVVREITASQLGVDISEVQPSTSLHDLGADELDIVELVMELEEEFDVSIPDDSITGGTGTEEWAAGSDKLTMLKLAEIVDGQRTHSTMP